MVRNLQSVVISLGMRRPVIALFVLIASTLVAFLLAQDKPTFRTGTTLVEFTVVALDNKGNPVTDLSKGDLTLTGRGQPPEIAFFRFDGDGAPSETAAPLLPLSPGFATNRPEYQPEPQQNVTAIVLDLINTAPPDQNGARAQLLRYLKALPANTPVGLFQFSARRVTYISSYVRLALTTSSGSNTVRVSSAADFSNLILTAAAPAGWNSSLPR